ncbi:prion-inhibition and propagation-domain-containing protein, partial [Mariannaea sp. PMI_226]
MEPVGLAVGVVGMAGLFTSCLDLLAKIDSYRDFGDDSRSLAARFNSDKLRFEKWGRAVGIEQGKLSSNHHQALDDQTTCSVVVDLITLIIQQISSEVDMEPAGNKSSVLNRPRPYQNIPTVSKRQKIAWALRGREKRAAQVEQFGILVQKLWELVPPEGDGTQPRPQANSLDDPTSMSSWIAELRQVLSGIEEEIKAETRRDLHAWIVGDTPNDLYNESIEKRLVDTCDWILTRPAFQTWLTSDPSREAARLLWVNGPAGFGKTIMCARVIQHLSMTLQTAVAHFFLSSNFASRDDPYSAMRSWIAQLMSQDEVAFNLSHEKWLAQNEKVASRTTIVALFQQILQAVPKCTFILDGLDECSWINRHYANNDSITSFLQAVGRAIENTTSRVMIVSRDEPEIRQALDDDVGEGFIEYRMTIDDVRNDVVSYSKDVVSRRLSNKSDLIKDDISQRMTDRCDGQFLWVKMLAESLRKGMNKMQLQRAISDTPTGLTQIYERNWEAIQMQPSRGRERAVSLLRWAAFSLRPLTISEITEAVLIQDGYTDIPYEELPDSIDTFYINTEIADHCGSLIEIREITGQNDLSLMTVHVTHFSVKQFLLLRMSYSESSLDANAILQASYEAFQNSLLAKKCVQYISFLNTWQTEQESICDLGTSFRNYAASSWYQHANLGLDDNMEMIERVNNFFDSSSKSWNAWRQWF